ncbi:unnamed protein product [Microthlaspi erraticum]|uniref:Uncharacterized protein n=1 Tax=Microthlaspi erraticum TaxID=1685480 RepID=A0A6D2IEU6_9BRAS|nr:unnamed protein product [Microthlaspi erraticum]
MILTYVLQLSYAGGGTYCAIASLRLMGFVGVDFLSNDSSNSIIYPSLLLNRVYRDKLMMLNFKVGLTNGATHAMHLGLVLFFHRRRCIHQQSCSSPILTDLSF